MRRRARSMMRGRKYPIFLDVVKQKGGNAKTDEDNNLMRIAELINADQQDEPLQSKACGIAASISRDRFNPRPAALECPMQV